MGAVLNDFFRCHPALLYAIAILASTAWALGFLPTSLLFIILFIFVAAGLQASNERMESLARIAIALLIGIATAFSVKARIQFPQQPLLEHGVAEVEITSVSESTMPFGNMWSFKGILHSYSLMGRSEARGVPVAISLRKEFGVDRPMAGFRYVVDAKVKKTLKGSYALVPSPKAQWAPIAHVGKLAEWRYVAKLHFRQHVESVIGDPHVAAFLTGITTGAFDDSVLQAELNRFGLQHLMAISGMHFSILATLLGLSLGFFLPRHFAAPLLIALMTLYFLFLGSSPSVTRAWIATSLGLSATFFNRQSRALNSLGIGLIAVVLYDPLAIQTIGFQFSFGVTASILLWFSSCDKIMRCFFYQRNLSEAIMMSTIDQYGYCFLHFFRQALSLCVAVNLLAAPLALFYFHKFPLIGLFYNLFFPSLVSISLLLIILACSSYLIIPWIGLKLHVLNEAFTQSLLNMAFHLPKSFDTYTWRIDMLSSEVLIGYVIVLFCSGAVVHQYSANSE